MYKPSENHSDELTEPLVEILFLLERYGCPWRRFLSSFGQRMGQKLQKMIPSAPFEHESRPSAEKVGKTMTNNTDIKSQPAPATRLDFSRRARALRPPHSNESFFLLKQKKFCKISELINYSGGHQLFQNSGTVHGNSSKILENFPKIRDCSW